MYGDAFFYELDGTLIKTNIAKFLVTHNSCRHEIEEFSGNNFVIRDVPTLIHNRVFMECCGQKWFFKIENAQVNLRERLENYYGIERLRIRQSTSRNLEFTENLIRARNLLKDLENFRRNEVYL